MNAPAIIDTMPRMSMGAPSERADEKEMPEGNRPDNASTIMAKRKNALKAGLSSIGVSTSLSRRPNSTRLIPCPALQPAATKAFRSAARTGPYTGLKPVCFLTSGADIPGAPNCGRIILLWDTFSNSPSANILFTSSSVPKVPFPAAHQTFMPFVSRTSIHASMPESEPRNISKLIL